MDISKIKLVAFDLDGTLLNTINTIEYHANNTLRHFGFPEISVDRYKILVGNGARILVERMLKENDNFNPDTFDEIYNYYTATYDSDVKIHTEIYPGIENMLKELKEQGFKLAVLSNKPNDAVQETVKLYFGDIFDSVYGAFEDLPKKPDTTILKKLMKELDCDIENSIYVGDTGVDMKTGKGGGLFTIGVLWGFRSKEELVENNADLIVSSTDEILKFASER